MTVPASWGCRRGAGGNAASRRSLAQGSCGSARAVACSSSAAVLCLLRLPHWVTPGLPEQGPRPLALLLHRVLVEAAESMLPRASPAASRCLFGISPNPLRRQRTQFKPHMGIKQKNAPCSLPAPACPTCHLPERSVPFPFISAPCRSPAVAALLGLPTPPPRPP